MRDKSVALSNLSIYYTWKKIKRVIQNNKSKISDPTRNDKFELPDQILKTILNKSPKL